MKLEMLPTSQNEAVFATVTGDNEVVWAYDNKRIFEQGHPWNVDISDVGSPFLVWRDGKIVNVEAAGWHDPNFVFQLRLSGHDPYEVVILAYQMAALVEIARED